jgi:hypothetical protein
MKTIALFFCYSFVFAVATLFSGRVVAATPAECAILERPGVYDFYSNFTKADQYKQVQNWVKNSNFQSYQDLTNAAVSLGIPIDDIPVSFNGVDARSNWHQWESAFESANSSEFSSNAQTSQQTITISGQITTQIRDCLNQGGLSFIAIPGANDTTFSLLAKFVPFDVSESHGNASITVSPASVNCQGSSGPSGATSALSSFDVNAGGTIFLCTRQAGADVTAILNSPLGARSLTLPFPVVVAATSTPQPVVSASVAKQYSLDAAERNIGLGPSG